MSITSQEFRAGMGLRVAGVAIVTARAGETVHGMTVTDFTGVSADPPLMLVCADKSSTSLGVIRAGGCFALNLLADDQVDLSNRFASKEHEWERFEGLECGRAATGAPLIPAALAAFDCLVEAEHDAGDHVIFVGRVEALVGGRPGEALVYGGGRYGRITPL